ncbi:MAG: LysR family transcriptional regulator [Anaerovoracaceae bacterium]|nr:LysR family transcriptional regulator [Anaerovoracaceae bacterium]
MDMDNYEIFLKVAETGNITRAAQILNYTQSGVSHAIAALEKETGFPVFVRSKTGVALTENAKEILPEIRRIVSMKSGLREKISAINNDVRGVLRIAVFTGMITEYMPRLMRDFQAVYPDVEFDLFNGTYDEICDVLRDGRAGLGFLPEPYCLEFDCIPFAVNSIYAVFSSDHPLAKRKRVSIEECIRYPVISEFKGCEGILDQILGEWKDRADIRYNFYEGSAMLSLVEKGFGVGFVRDTTLRNYAMEISAAELSPKVETRIYAVTKKGEHLTYLARVFRDFACGYSDK